MTARALGTASRTSRHPLQPRTPDRANLTRAWLLEKPLWASPCAEITCVFPIVGSFHNLERGLQFHRYVTVPLRLVRSPDRWVRMQTPARPATLRLFCFPDAGESAHAFRGWPAQLPASIEVHGLSVPTRGHREDEHLDLDAMVKAIGAEIDVGPDPFAILGLGTGALFAFAWTRYLESTGRKPSRLVVADCPAPGAGNAGTTMDERERTRLERVPSGFLRDPEVRAQLLPALRSHLALCREWKPEPQPIETPIVAIGSAEEFGESAVSLEQWATWTQASCEIALVPGGSATLGTHYREFFDVIEDAVAPSSECDPSLWMPGSSPGDLNAPL